MGLDIEAGRRARHVGGLDEDRLDAISVYANPHFAERADGLADGYYEAEETLRFRAGSYSGYGHYRDALSLLALGVETTEVYADPGEYAGRPFIEQINFSDCEGAFGPATSAKLAADYAEWDDRAREAWGADSYEYRVYRDFRAGYELAADAGVLQYA